MERGAELVDGGVHLGALFKSRESGSASEPLPLSVFGAI
jgi:hypothetical protein